MTQHTVPPVTQTVGTKRVTDQHTVPAVTQTVGTKRVTQHTDSDKIVTGIPPHRTTEAVQDPSTSEDSSVPPHSQLDEVGKATAYIHVAP